MIDIVDYGMGNLGSILNMLRRIGEEAQITSDPDKLLEAKKLILPGIGAFDTGMRNLKERKLSEVLDQKVRTEKTPILGICLGMQLFTRRSEEGDLPGLGWIDAETKRFDFSAAGESLRVPHMGWNFVRPTPKQPLLDLAQNEWRFYFVHSYHVVCRSEADVLCKTHYGYDFASGVMHENILGVQFHPEKSHRFGMSVLKRFAEM